jgi:hypothetical protein
VDDLRDRNGNYSIIVIDDADDGGFIAVDGQTLKVRTSWISSTLITNSILVNAFGEMLFLPPVHTG